MKKSVMSNNPGSHTQNTSPNLLSNLAWKFSERTLSQLIKLVIAIILARILGPRSYGLVGMVTVFIALSYVIVDGGFNNALIQKKNSDALDFSTVLYFSVTCSLFIYALLFVCAPYIAAFYGEGYEELTPILRVLGLQVVIYSMNSVQQAYVAKRMMFKKFFFATTWGTVISGAIGLYMAYNGFGVWALVWQGIMAAFIELVALYLVTRKRPLLAFSLERLKGLFRYGVNIFAGSVLISIYTEMRSLIIGKLYTPQDLGFYTKGRAYPNLVVTNINTSIGAVLFPKISLEQNDLAKVKATTRNSIRFSAYVMFPFMLGLAAVAEPLIRLLLTEKWLPCVSLLQWFCIVYLFQPIHTANIQAIKAIGRSDIFLKLEILKKTLELVSLLAVMWISVEAIVINMAVMTTLFTFINAYPNRKLINYTYKEQFHDMASPLGMVVVMVAAMLSVRLFVSNDLLLLLTQTATGLLVYVVLSAMTNNKEYQFILHTIKSRLGK